MHISPETKHDATGAPDVISNHPKPAIGRETVKTGDMANKFAWLDKWLMCYCPFLSPPSSRN